VIVDLAAQDLDHSRDTDVAIVGAGVAGLMLARRLRSKNIRVLVLESGDREQRGDTHPLNDVVQLGDTYTGAAHGRFRCLGGSSTRWGGALIPFVDHDLAPRPYLNLPAWPVKTEALWRYLFEIESVFRVDAGSYEEEFVQQIGAAKHVPTGDPDFKARFAKWPVFKRRNVAELLEKLIERDADLEVWINCTATSFDLNTEKGLLQSIIGRDHKTGKIVKIKAKYFVICAGAIESTRLLLLIDHQHDGRVFQTCNALGRFFYDHISIPMAWIDAKSVTKLNRMAGFRFTGTTMRSLRFELSPAAQKRECIGGAFAHISFQTESPTGFDALRRILRKQQQAGRIEAPLLLSVVRHMPYMGKLALWRVLHKQLFWPAPARYELHVVIEQIPQADNYIKLSQEKDPLGLSTPAINWKIGQQERRAFLGVMRCFDRFWRRQGLQQIGDLHWICNPDSDVIEGGGDVYHPGGTTRMGMDRRCAVVDSNLRSFEIPNLWVCSTSAFPTGGSANPTLMLMLFAMRLGDHLYSKLSSSS
jgi:choline dehydrogenase-like flavoprotein